MQSAHLLLAIGACYGREYLASKPLNDIPPDVLRALKKVKPHYNAEAAKRGIRQVTRSPVTGLSGRTAAAAAPTDAAAIRAAITPLGGADLGPGRQVLAPVVNGNSKSPRRAVASIALRSGLAASVQRGVPRASESPTHPTLRIQISLPADSRRMWSMRGARGTGGCGPATRAETV